MLSTVTNAQLASMLGDPVELYRNVTSKEHYSPKPPAVAGDCELLLTDIAARGRLLVVTLAHDCKLAYASLLSIEDALLMRERLGELVPELTSALLRADSQRRPRGLR